MPKLFSVMAEKETNDYRPSRIVKSIMQALDFESVQSFADALGVGYMTVYYAYKDQVAEISPKIIDALASKFPQVRRLFVTQGVGPVLEGDLTISPYIKPESVTIDDMLMLLDRLTKLLENVQAREERLEKKIERVDELEKRITTILAQVDKTPSMI